MSTQANAPLAFCMASQMNWPDNACISSVRVVVSDFSDLPNACHLHAARYGGFADSRTLTTHFMSFQSNS